MPSNFISNSVQLITYFHTQGTLSVTHEIDLIVYIAKIKRLGLTSIYEKLLIFNLTKPFVLFTILSVKGFSYVFVIHKSV